ncbi:MAG: transporter substrate-binding domain-containing protein [Erysipelotrichaceae bacterium]|nr:transporter substrate-binding domain-containing protein [Erysipelotrichaceae bacterium]MBR3693075.1 transporter substrate-binding domain-containing protein [Erysipelotrichales bacterium]
MRRLAMMALALMCVLTATGCSNDSNNNNTDDSNVLRVGMECNYAPFNWTETTASDSNVPESNGGYCAGYDVEIAKALASSLDMELEVVKLEWDALLPALDKDVIDAIVAGMTDTPKRRENADFTSPYYQSEMVMIVRADSEYANATSLEDFSGANVLGQLNTMYDTVIDQIPNVNHMVPLESYSYMIASLLNNEADALTAETPVAQGAIDAHEGLAMVVFQPGQGFELDPSETSVSIAVKKGNTELLNSLESALSNISEEERLQMMADASANQPSSN